MRGRNFGRVDPHRIAVYHLRCSRPRLDTHGPVGLQGILDA